MTTCGAHEREADEPTVVYRAEYNPDDGTALSTSVLMALESVPEFDMEDGDTVVFDYIDLDALDDLFRPASAGDRGAHVTFPAGEYSVTVSATGEITVREC